jgi:hypothetical protein
MHWLFPSLNFWLSSHLLSVCAVVLKTVSFVLYASGKSSGLPERPSELKARLRR